MESLEPGLFALAARRLAWLDQRQTVLARNVANTDTPGYTPRDIAPFAATLADAPFAATLADAAGTMRRTSPRQLPGRTEPPLAGRARPDGRQPDGNAVSLDMQLRDIADTATSQQLVTSIYSKYLAMFQLALGHGNG